MLSIAVLLCGMCHNHLKPLSAPILKKGKKKKEVQTNAQVINCNTKLYYSGRSQNNTQFY